MQDAFVVVGPSLALTAVCVCRPVSAVCSAHAAPEAEPADSRRADALAAAHSAEDSAAAEQAHSVVAEPAHSAVAAPVHCAAVTDDSSPDEAAGLIRLAAILVRAADLARGTIRLGTSVRWRHRRMLIARRWFWTIRFRTVVRCRLIRFRTIRLCCGRPIIARWRLEPTIVVRPAIWDRLVRLRARARIGLIGLRPV